MSSKGQAYWVLENVKGKLEYRTLATLHVNIKYLCISSYNPFVSATYPMTLVGYFIFLILDVSRFSHHFEVFETKSVHQRLHSLPQRSTRQPRIW